MIHLVRERSLLGALTRRWLALCPGAPGDRLARWAAPQRAGLARLLRPLPAEPVPARLTRSWPWLRRRRCRMLCSWLELDY